MKFWAAPSGSSQRDSVPEPASPALLSDRSSAFITVGDISAAEESLELWFPLHPLTMSYFYSLCPLFVAHSVIFLCKWMKWPDFTALLCVDVEV